MLRDGYGINRRKSHLREVYGMLLRFGAANHRSIRDYQVMLLSASKGIREDGMVVPVPTLKEEAVAVVALYGANAAGKSNLIDAMDEMQRAIIRSHKGLGADDPIPRAPFRLDEGIAPTRFECTFTMDGRQVNERDSHEPEGVYEYGFEYTAKEFRREWLYRIVRKERQSTQKLFERRTEDGRVCVAPGAQLRGENKTIANLTRPNSLFLSAAAQNNHPQLTEIYRYFSRWKVILGDGTMSRLAVAEHLSGYHHLDRLLTLVKQADIGISEINVDEEEVDEAEVELARDFVQAASKRTGGSEEFGSWSESIVDRVRHRKCLHFIHEVGAGEPLAFDYDTQSKGTQTLVSLLIPALEALSQGSLLVVDELDTSLHPSLARAFVSLFSKESSNPRGAQLVFWTHDVTLLSGGLLRRDEIWMADKNHEGVSRFTPMSDFKLRSRDDIEKAYRNGRLGGIPSGSEFAIELDDDQLSTKP